MSQSEFLSILPIIFYGLAIAEITEHWRSIFNSKPSAPFILFVVILFEQAIYSVYRFYDVIHQLPDLSYWAYFGACVPPMLLLFTVKALTPDKGQPPEGYMKKNASVIFGLASAYSLSTFLFNTGIDGTAYRISALIPILFAAMAVTKNLKGVYLIAVIQLILIIAELTDIPFMIKW